MMESSTNRIRVPRGTANQEIAMRKILVCVTAWLGAFALSPWARADVQNYTSPGTYTWTAPAGVTSVQVECWGMGGDGSRGFRSDDDPDTPWGGGGGGGGAYARVNSFAVTPGQNYAVVVGMRRGEPYYDITNTTFNTSTCLAARGQDGGNPDGGSGGQASASTGDVKTSGQDGGGGGQGSAGDGGAGANGGAGGANGFYGSSGTAPSGGGGGGSPDGGGGGGAPGQVRLTYTVVVSPSISSLSTTSGPVGTAVTIAGSNFGSSQGSSTAKFNGTTASVTSWSAGSIGVTVPSGATTGNVVVTVNGLASNGLNFTVTTPVATPTFTPAAGTYNSGQTVTIGTTTPGATIRYTTDGSTPTSTTGTVYSSPVSVNSTTTIKAIAYKSGWNDSSVASAAYTLAAAIPTFTPPAATYTSNQSISITSTSSGVSIRYTLDGSTPSPTAGTLYAGPVAVSANTTIKAIAYLSGWTSSAVSTAVYIMKTPAPAFSPPGGNYNSSQSVTLSGASGTTIRYTTDGSTPSDTVGTVYSTPIPVVSGTTTIKAVAYGGGWAVSDVASATYGIQDFTISATPSSNSGNVGGTVNYTVTTTAINGFNTTQSFAVSGLPSGVTASFSPATLPGSGSTTMTVTVPLGTPPGTSALTITASSTITGGTLSHSAGVSLVVGDSAPGYGSVTPSSGSGWHQTYTFTFSDPNGATDISWTQMDVGNSTAQACVVFFGRGPGFGYGDPSMGGFWLEDDAGQGWSAPVIVGQPGTAENSQCIVDAGASSLQLSGTNLTINVAVSFKSGYAGAKTVWEMAVDNEGLSNGGYYGVGSYTVTAPPAPLFSLAAQQVTAQPIAPGASAAYTVTVTPQSGFTGLVKLENRALTTGETATFTPASVSGGSGTSTLTVNTDSQATPVGSINFSIIGMGQQGGGWVEAQTAATLDVELPPGPVTLSSPVNGATNQSVITALVWNAAARAASYSVYLHPPSGPPVVATMLAGTTNYTPSPVLAGNTTYSWYVVATNTAGSTQSATWTFTTATPDFTITVTPVSPTLLVGDSSTTHTANYAVTVAGTYGFNGTVSFGVSGSPAGANTGFSPVTVTVPNSTTTTLSISTVPWNAAAGNYPLVVTASSGAKARSATATLAVQDFQLSISPPTQSVACNGSTQYTVTATSLNGFSGGILLDSLPPYTNTSESYNPSVLYNGSGTTTLTVSTSIGPNCVPVTPQVQVSGHTGQSSPYVYRYTWANLAVNGASAQDFSIAVPSSAVVPASGSATYTVTVNRASNFTGAVNLSASTLPSGVTASFSPTTVTGTTSTLTLSAVAGAQSGDYYPTITGTSGTLSHASTPISLTVGQSPTIDRLTISPGWLTSGASATVSLGLSAVAPAGGVSINLMSSNTAAFPNANVAIPAGQQTWSTQVTAGSVSASTVVTVTADYGSRPTASITVAPAPPAALQTFMTCLSAQGFGTCTPASPCQCTLPAGRYLVSQPIVIGRSNVTAQGANNDRSQTVLLREPNFPVNTNPAPPSAMMQVDGAGPPLSGVTIQNLTFCGGSYPGDPGNPAPSSFCSSAYQAMGLNPQGNTTCGQWTQESNAGTNPALCVDLEVDNAETAPYPTNPFNNSGPYSVTINNVDLEDAGGHALQLFGNAGWSGKKVNDVYIHNSAINSSGVTGILLGANTPPLDRKICDSDPNFANDPNIFPPRNIRIESNTFQNNSTGVVAGAPARWVGLRSNNFINNFINPQGKGNSSGGNVVFEPCADTVEISGNTMTGPAVNLDDATPHTLGLELWGRNITVTGGNYITQFPNEGILLSGTYNATVSGNTIVNNDKVTSVDPSNTAYWTGGIGVATPGPGPCDQIPRDTKNVVINGNAAISGQPYGIFFLDRGVARNASQDIAIDSTNVSGTSGHPIAIANDFISVTPGAYYVIPDVLDMPRALAPDAVSPVQSRCSTPGSRRETFTFSASDTLGPGNILDLEVIFSDGGADADGTGGPDTGPQCHLYYAPPTPNVIYLDGPNGGYTWPYSSTVGPPAGTVLDNGYCRIHAESSSSTYLLESKILNVTLDVEFLTSSSRKHIYTVAVNNQLVSNGGNWTYWGWWATPSQ